MNACDAKPKNHFDFEAAANCPPSIRFGTSTWTYPGWKGLIYKAEYKNEKDFKSLCLKEYSAFPWFRSVGIDSSFYAPLSTKLLQHYSSLVPPEFVWVSKAWERITVPKWPSHARYSKLAGTDNPDFLNADLFCEQVLKSYEPGEIYCHTGPFVFQFPPLPESLLKSLDFLSRLRSFLTSLPTRYRYAVEVRNRSILCPQYFAVLNDCGATHCFNHWHMMPSLREQMQRAAEAGGLNSNFFVARILTPLGVSYEGAVKLFKPYDAIKSPNPEMRADVLRLIKRALQRKIEAFIIVNNRCEGNAPLTIDAIGRMLLVGLRQDGPDTIQ